MSCAAFLPNREVYQQCHSIITVKQICLFFATQKSLERGFIFPVSLRLKKKTKKKPHNSSKFLKSPGHFIYVPELLRLLTEQENLYLVSS